LKFILLILLFAACACGCGSEHNDGYEEKVILLDQSIARHAAEHGIDFKRADDVTNIWVGHVAFGGAGGAAVPEIRQNNLSAFLNETINLSLDTIRYVDVLDLPCLTRNFYAFNKRGGPWVTRSETYCILEGGYVFKELNATALRYKTKKTDLTWLFILIILLLAGLALHVLGKTF